MAWIYLLIASIFELGWPLGFKLASLHKEYFWQYIIGACFCMICSGVFLYIAQKTIPIATAYIVWTGIGAIATFIIGICYFNDTASFMRIFCAFLILIGIIGLKVFN
ncbi:MAG: SMR family transporter [Bacteroidales bacterium]